MAIFSRSNLITRFGNKGKEEIVDKIIGELKPRFVYRFGESEPIGINDSREIQRKAYLAPGDGASQVFFIFQASLMTREAANSLLKILEEPPDGSYLFLFSESVAGIPETILSRLRHISFTGYNDEVETAPQQDEAIQFFHNEMSRLKKELEDEIGHGKFDREKLVLLKKSIGLLGLLYTSRTSPRYILDSYSLRK